MQSVEIVCVGKTGRGFYTEGCAEYIKRLAPFFKLTLTELAETRLVDDSPAGREKVITDESARIMKHLESRARALVAALCVEGKSYTSEALAQLTADAANNSKPLILIIGGSLGLSGELKSRADIRLSLSSLTLPHQLARLVLLEQLYRAATINNNIKYHK